MTNLKEFSFVLQDTIESIKLHQYSEDASGSILTLDSFYSFVETVHNEQVTVSLVMKHFIDKKNYVAKCIYK